MSDRTIGRRAIQTLSKEGSVRRLVEGSKRSVNGKSSRRSNSFVRRFSLIIGLLTFIPLLTVCSPNSPKLVPQQTAKPERVRDSSDVTLSFQRSVDILFVIDDSGSMDIHQRNLKNNIDLFTKGMNTNQTLDYHIGVLTSTMDDSWGPKPPGYGSKGELNGVTKYVTKLTPNRDVELKKNLVPGSDGSGTEYFFTPVQAALTPPLINGINNGFFRPDAYLAIIFVTDADDQSRLSADDFYKFLLGLKKNDPDKIIGYGVYIPTTDRSCDRSYEPEPRKLEAFFKLTKATTMGLCDVDYGMKLAEIGADLVRKVGSILYLSRPAIPDSIRVTFGSQTIPNDPVHGWVYDPARNALLFGEEIDLQPEPTGTEIQVDFMTTEY